MAKSTILKQLANNEISLDVAFSRLMIIASDINDNELLKWAENELNGYSPSSELPPYRNLGIGYIVYAGINGSFQVKNQPMPFTSFLKEEREIIMSLSAVQDSIGAIQARSISDANGKNEYALDLTFLASSVFERQGIRCLSIHMTFDSNAFLNLLNGIRTKLLSIFIRLDKELGCLDDLDINTEHVEPVKMNELSQNIKSMIYADDRSEAI